MFGSILLRVEDVVSIWPGRDNGRVCVFLNSSNEEFKTNLPKEEAELLLELKKLHKENPDMHKKLVGLIENYGQMMYEKGSFDAEQTEDI